MLRAAAFAAAGTFEADCSDTVAGLIQAAADAAMPQVLWLRFHICMDFQTIVPVKHKNAKLIGVIKTPGFGFGIILLSNDLSRGI